MRATGPGLVDEVEVPVAFAVIIVLGHDGVDGCSVLPAGIEVVAVALVVALDRSVGWWSVFWRQPRLVAWWKREPKAGRQKAVCVRRSCGSCGYSEGLLGLLGCLGDGDRLLDGVLHGQCRQGEGWMGVVRRIFLMLLWCVGVVGMG